MIDPDKITEKEDPSWDCDDEYKTTKIVRRVSGEKMENCMTECNNTPHCKYFAFEEEPTRTEKTAETLKKSKSDPVENKCTLYINPNLKSIKTSPSSSNGNKKLYKYVQKRFNEEKGFCKIVRRTPHKEKDELEAKLDNLNVVKWEDRKKTRLVSEGPIEALLYTGKYGVSLETCKKMCSVNSKCSSFYYSNVKGDDLVDCNIVLVNGAIGDLSKTGNCYVK